MSEHHSAGGSAAPAGAPTPASFRPWGPSPTPRRGGEAEERSAIKHLIGASMVTR